MLSINFLQNTTTKENETFLAIGTAYVQGEDVAARGRVLLFSLSKNTDDSQVFVWVTLSFSVRSFCIIYNSFHIISFANIFFFYICNLYVCFFQVSEVYSKELKGAISALAALQGHLLIASGPKIILHKWTGTELTGVAFYDAPPLYVVSLNIVSVTNLRLGVLDKAII